MTSQNPTIIDLKIAFLRAQILALSAPLRPSSTFTRTNESLPAETALGEKSITDVMERVNALLKKHNKLFYGPQATRHVAEQVDTLYWAYGEPSASLSGGVLPGEEWRDRGEDLRDDRIIEQLPADYPSAATVAKSPELGERFSKAAARLKELSSQRREAKERAEEYRKWRTALGAFGPEGEVQENLVTRNGGVEAELERMRMLMLRVERGLEGLKRGEEDEGEGRAEVGETDWEEEEKRQLDSILARAA